MRGNLAVKLGSISGIPLYLDYSWFIIFALIAYTVGFGLMPESYPGLSWEIYLSIGILSAILLLVSIVLHELAHSLVAKNNGLKISRITLYLLGGVSEMEEEPPTASLELKMSAAGPLTSIAIAVICLGGWIVSIDVHASVLIQGPLYYSFLVNALVAGFNLIPAFPMDGGRILRAVLWRRNHDMMGSTKTASRVGRMFGYLIAFVGIFFLIAVNLFTGLWLILIGWFITSAASSEMNQLTVQRDLSTLTARDVMTRNVDTVSGGITLSQLSSHFLEHKHNGFPVLGSQGEVVGCVTMHDLKQVKRDLWDTTFVRDVMTPKEKLVTVKENEPAQTVLTLMQRNRIGRIFVVGRNDELEGIITRSDIMKTIQMQESIYGSRRGFTAPQNIIPVEKGMLFEIECPPGDWSALFNTSEFTLVAQNVIQVSDGRQTTQFTFEALQKGKFEITLQPKEAGKNLEARAIRYTIVVS